MSILLRKHHGEAYLTRMGKLGIISLISSFSSALVITIWAIYMDSFLKSVSAVGFFSAFLTFIGITSYFILIPFVETTGKSKIFSTSLVVFGIGYIVFALTKSFWFFFIVSVIITIFGTLRLTSFGLIIRDSSSKKSLSKNEGIRFTFINLSYIIGPIIAGYVSEKFGISIIFLLAALFLFISLILIKTEKIVDNTKQRRSHKNIIKNSIEFFTDKKRLLAYFIGGGVSFWWILIYLFIPLYMIRNGLSKVWVGYFLFLIPIPLIFLEYYFSKIAQKHGVKTLFKLGFLIPALISLVAYFISDIFILLTLLILASVGMAMLEPTTETYFFNISTKKDEQRFYGPYNTRIEVAGLIGKFLPALILLYFPLKSIFLFFSLAMFVFFLASFKVENVAGKRRKKQ